MGRRLSRENETVLCFYTDCDVREPQRACLMDVMEIFFFCMNLNLTVSLFVIFKYVFK